MEQSSIKSDVFPIVERSKFSADALRRARIALGEYARTSGVYDPVEVLAFTQMCIRDATVRLAAGEADDGDALVHHVLRVASASCGLCALERGETMEANSKPTDTTVDESHLATAPSFVAIVAEQTEVVAVPPSQKRAMPPQPLGELPHIRPATLWSSSVQVVRRAASSLLTSMFARSD
jgi:hypothetical protein